MAGCSHDCSSCSENCSSRDSKSLLKKPHELSDIKKIIAVVSGKGGVGKSLVTSLLACRMRVGDPTCGSSYGMDSIASAVIGGTSLAVYAAAGLIHYFPGKRLVLINKTPTPCDQEAALVLHGAIGEIFGRL